MKKRTPSFLLVVLIIAQAQVQAQVQSIAIAKKDHEHKPLERLDNKEIKNLYSNSIFNRNQWGLTEKEWQRYKKLMQGVRGSISPSHISPIEVLGTHARSDKERMRYAKMWAKIMYEDTDRILAFQQAYNTAFDQMYGHIPYIDDSKLNLPKNQKNNIQEGDRILLFVKLDSSCKRCDSVARELLLITETKDIQVDIFFLDATSSLDDIKIREWAKKNVYDKSKLKSGRITLNHDNKRLFRITKNPIIEVPVMFKTNEKETRQIFI